MIDSPLFGLESDEEDEDEEDEDELEEDDDELLDEDVEFESSSLILPSFVLSPISIPPTCCSCV